MADVRQAAKWIKQGKRVARKTWCGHTLAFHPLRKDCEWPLSLEDLLANDWKIAVVRITDQRRGR
jgi:hypothetical protein